MLEINIIVTEAERVEALLFEGLKIDVKSSISQKLHFWEEISRGVEKQTPAES